MTRSVVVVSMAVAFIAMPVVARGQSACPPEVQAAKEALKARQTTAVPTPRQLVGSRSHDVEAPRGQDVQAPRGQDVQAPRGQDVQAPRGQDVQAPRAPAGSRTEAPAASPSGTPALEDAERLVKDAEAACAAKDMTRAASSAKSALDLLKSIK